MNNSNSPRAAGVVNLTRGADGDAIRQDSGRQEGQMVKNLQDWRDGHRNDPGALDRKYPTLPFDPQKPMRPIYHGLARLTITDGFKLTENHARDLFHALAAVRCAEMVTLDGHWIGQVRQLKLPADFVKLYSEANLEQFLTDLERPGDAVAARQVPAAGKEGTFSLSAVVAGGTPYANISIRRPYSSCSGGFPRRSAMPV